jgi:hypothetical protein
MTEAEWLACADPVPILAFLRGTASERKFGLFACACCCQVGDAVSDERSRAAFFVAERFADGGATREELDAARKAAWEVAHDWRGEGGSRAHNAARAIAHTSAFPASRYARNAAADAAYAAPCAARDAAEDVWGSAGYQKSPEVIAAGKAMLAFAREAARAAEPGQVVLLRDIFGNPFRPVSVDPAWLAWSDGAVVRVARAIYEERAFDRLPILADALMDAGCDNQVILDHCRDAGPHVRGCWALDLILGKA